jgi:hypothetical protein
MHLSISGGFVFAFFEKMINNMLAMSNSGEIAAAEPTGLALMDMYQGLAYAESVMMSAGDVVRGASVYDTVNGFIGARLGSENIGERIQSGGITKEELVEVGKAALVTFATRQTAESEIAEARAKRDALKESIKELHSELIGSPIHVQVIDKPGAIQPIQWKRMYYSRTMAVQEASGLLAHPLSYRHLRLLPEGFLAGISGSCYTILPVDSSGKRRVKLSVGG